MITVGCMKQKVWITKYALTKGIYEVNDELTPVTGSPGKFYASPHRHALTRDWAPTREEAVKQAEAMRDRKLASINKQIAKLKAMKF